MSRRVLVLLVAGLTPRLLRSGRMPRAEAFASARALRPLLPDLPAVTCTVQASFLTGASPARHGAVANGWYFRELAEVWLWRQSAHLLHAPTILDRWRAAHPGSSTAQVFWWWNLPSRADLSVTPRPTYYADGRKGPDIHAHPVELRARLLRRLGDFPLFHFWGPGADIRSTRWIVDAALDILEQDRPGLTLVYLPHLDYDLQRFGPNAPEALTAAAAVDQDIGRLLDHAHAEGIETLILSEYGITPARSAVFLNRLLRQARLLAVHPARNGALLDPGNSRAFAVCDHQCAHVYVAATRDVSVVRRLLESRDGVATIWGREEMAAIGLDHPRSGELFVLAAKDRWFAYPYWDEGDAEPDFARTVDIHRKPGYDPCELFLDPALPLLRPRLALKLLGKKLGFRSLMNVIPLATDLVRGTHGRLPDDPDEGPVWIGSPQLLPRAETVTAASALSALS